MNSTTQRDPYTALLLARHASLPGSYSDLVIAPARPHVDEVDDGGDYGSRDEEY